VCQRAAQLAGWVEAFNVSGIIPSIACNLDADILSASLKLFEEEKIGAIEWSFDTLYNINEVPDWFTELIDTCSLKID